MSSPRRARRSLLSGLAGRPGRRGLTMIHGILAFMFNIAVLALSINIIASVI